MDYYGLLILLVGVVLPMAFLLFLIFLLKKTRGFLANASLTTANHQIEHMK